ncbi:MAG TPA: dienelactone hydrolase family protein [Bacillota bacterium]
MAEMILFHHAQGRTPGVVAFAEALRAHGHRVSVPDLYDGATFATVEEGVAHAEQIGFETIIARGVAAAEPLRPGLVYAGFSLGVLPAQKLAQTVDGCKGAILYHSGVPPATFGTAWPRGVPLQVHVMEDDPWGEVDVIQELVSAVPGAQLFLYPGSAHLFTDSSLAEYDEEATRLVLDRTLDLLSRVD